MLIYNATPKGAILNIGKFEDDTVHSKFSHIKCLEYDMWVIYEGDKVDVDFLTDSLKTKSTEGQVLETVNSFLPKIEAIIVKRLGDYIDVWVGSSRIIKSRPANNIIVLGQDAPFVHGFFARGSVSPVFDASCKEIVSIFFKHLQDTYSMYCLEPGKYKISTYFI